MSRNLDTSLQAALPVGLIQPVILAALNFRSGVAYVWSGVGPLVYNGNTYQGVGSLGKISPVSEGVDVQADGMAIQLSGLQLVPFASSAPPAGIAPPRSPGAGEFVAWIFPASVTETIGNPDAGTITGTIEDLVLELTKSAPLGHTNVTATWGGFEAPALPPDAVVTDVYIVALLSGSGTGAFNGGSFPIPSNGTFSGQYDVVAGTTLAALEAATPSASIGSSITEPDFVQTVTVQNLCAAVYYTSASNAMSVLGEALGDIQLGAPAQIYFGLMQNGALIGSPYMIFAGQIDQPTVDVDTETISISLALENKLSNLARPTARRYTAADQNLAYSNDTGFNFVEMLNDIALRWGS